MVNVPVVVFLGLLACIQPQICTGSKDVKKDVKVNGRSRGWRRDTVPFVRNNLDEINENLSGSSRRNTVISSVIDESLTEQDTPIVTDEDAPMSYVKCTFTSPTTIKLESNDMDIIFDNKQGDQEAPIGSIIIGNNQGNFPKSPKNNEREIESDIPFVDRDYRRKLQRFPTILRELAANEFGLSELGLRRALRRLNSVNKLEMLKKIHAMEALNQLGIGSLDDLYGYYQSIPKDVRFRVKGSNEVENVGGSNGVANVRKIAGSAVIRNDLGYNGDGGGFSISFEGKGRRKMLQKDNSDRLPWELGDGELGMQISGVRLASGGSAGARRRARLGRFRESEAAEKVLEGTKVIKNTIRADSPSLEV